MESGLILVTLLNELLLVLLPIKEFFIYPMFNNKFMEYFIKWTTVACYGVAFITCVVAMYFFAIALIKKNQEENEKSKSKNKVGLIMFLISVTATAVAGALMTIFR